jgi:pilus assembly protein CpaF
LPPSPWLLFVLKAEPSRSVFSLNSGGIAAHSRIEVATDHSPRRYWSFREIGGTHYYGDSRADTLQQPHVLRLETRPPNIEGRGEITQQALLRNALRMRPDRVVLGEVRGAEALDMLNAMNTGHDGSFTTLHANTPRDALSRLENMINMAGLNMPPKTTRYQISSVIHVVVQVTRLPDGRRKVASIQEVVGMEAEVVSMQEIFAFYRTGIDARGGVQGHFSATGIRPKLLERAAAHGVTLAEGTFDTARHAPA